MGTADDGIHSMCRTRASLVHRRTKRNAARRTVARHAKLERTVRDLGIEVEDALEMAEASPARSVLPPHMKDARKRQDAAGAEPEDRCLSRSVAHRQSPASA